MAVTLPGPDGRELECFHGNVTQALRRRSDLPPEPIRVLIAEDDENFGMWLAAVARRLGLVVTSVANGAEALEKLRSSEFDLLISDLEMPKNDGLELITSVRADRSISDLYAVMLTAHDRPAIKVRALTLGYDDFLSKSCSEVEVVAKVTAARRMLARQRTLDADVREWRDIANRDELTKVAARRFFFEQVERHLADEHDIGIVLIDVDDFKTINDAFGHLTGDRVLRDVGALFLRRTRNEDVIARYGGDEFVLLSHNVKIDETRLLAERLVADLAGLEWRLGETTLRLTVSVGIACSHLISAPTVDRLLDAADQDLYMRKSLKKRAEGMTTNLLLPLTGDVEIGLHVLGTQGVASDSLNVRPVDDGKPRATNSPQRGARR